MNIRVLLASVLGNALEFYDFALFGIFSAMFAKLFFAEQDQFSGILSSLCIFAAGLLMRPLGSIFFGHFGDKIGRKKALSYSIIGMAFPTFLMGLLPTYAMIGIAAPILLTVCRLLQGFCAGGEDNGSAIFLMEHTAKKYEGFAGAFILSGSGIGTVVAMFMGYLTLQTDMPSWAWRIPFILGFSVGLIGLYLRLKVGETPEFQKVKDRKEFVKLPLKEVILKHPLTLITTIGIAGFGGSLAYSLVVYLSIHLNTVAHLPLGNSILYGMLGFAIYSVMLPIVGKLSDRFGKIGFMFCGTILTILFIYPVFIALQNGNFFVFIIAICCFITCFNAPRNAFLINFYPVKYRYTGIAFSSSIGIAIFGGGMPIISTILVKYTGNSAAPAFYLMFMALLATMALLVMKSKLIKPIRPL